MKTIIMLAGVFLLVSCEIGVGDSEGNLTDEVSYGVSEYQILNLATFKPIGKKNVTDIKTNDAYKNNLMVFKLVSNGRFDEGSADAEIGHQLDETQTNKYVKPYYMAVFETTNAQWAHITKVDYTGSDDYLPVTDLSLDQINAVVSSKKYFTLPTNTQWEYACKAGTTTPWSSGNDKTTIKSCTRDLSTTPSAPRIVGTENANPFGLFDMHGNVWEITKDGSIRGGSWYNSLTMARSANKILIDKSESYPLAGVRFVLVKE